MIEKVKDFMLDSNALLDDTMVFLCVLRCLSDLQELLLIAK